MDCESRLAHLACRRASAEDGEADWADDGEADDLLVAEASRAEVDLGLGRQDQVLARRRIRQVHELEAKTRRQKGRGDQSTPADHWRPVSLPCAAGASADHEVLQQRVLILHGHASVYSFGEVRRLLQEERVLVGQHARVDGDRLLLRREDAVHHAHVGAALVRAQGEDQHARAQLRTAGSQRGLAVHAIQI